MKTGVEKLRRQSGMGLIELMVSLLIGSILMVGAVTIFIKSKDTYRLNETMGRIQDLPDNVWDLTPEGLRLASDLTKITGPTLERLIELEMSEIHPPPASQSHYKPESANHQPDPSRPRTPRARASSRGTSRALHGR